MTPPEVAEYVRQHPGLSASRLAHALPGRRAGRLADIAAAEAAGAIHRAPATVPVAGGRTRRIAGLYAGPLPVVRATPRLDLHALRAAAGLSQAVAGALLGVRRQTFAAWERGVRPTPLWALAAFTDRAERVPAELRASLLAQVEALPGLISEDLSYPEGCAPVVRRILRELHETGAIHTRQGDGPRQVIHDPRYGAMYEHAAWRGHTSYWPGAAPPRRPDVEVAPLVELSAAAGWKREHLAQRLGLLPSELTERAQRRYFARELAERASEVEAELRAVMGEKADEHLAAWRARQASIAEALRASAERVEALRAAMDAVRQEQAEDTARVQAQTGVSQTVLAQRLGVHQSTISRRIQRGRVLLSTGRARA